MLAASPSTSDSPLPRAHLPQVVAGALASSAPLQALLVEQGWDPSAFWQVGLSCCCGRGQRGTLAAASKGVGTWQPEHLAAALLHISNPLRISHILLPPLFHVSNTLFHVSNTRFHVSNTFSTCLTPFNTFLPPCLPGGDKSGVPRGWRRARLPGQRARRVCGAV